MKNNILTEEYCDCSFIKDTEGLRKELISLTLKSDGDLRMYIFKLSQRLLSNYIDRKNRPETDSISWLYLAKLH